MSSSNRDETQQKAFLRWANIVLSKHPDEQPVIEDLIESIHDGITLGRLAEAVIPTTLKLNQPKNDLIRIQNITSALNSFESNGCKLINIHSTAISRGDKKAILGLMFQLCIHFQVQSKDEGGKTVSVSQLKQQLVAWVNEMLSLVKPEDNLAIRVAATEVYNELPLHCEDLDKSLHDGTILMGLIAALLPQYAGQIIKNMNNRIDDILNKRNVEEYNANFSKFENGTQPPITAEQYRHIATTFVAMNTALEVMEIPLLVDPDDMVLNGDSSANLAYLSYFYNMEIDLDSIKINSGEKTTLDPKDLTQTDFIPDIPPNVVTLETFDPAEEYSDDVILFL